SPDEVGLGYAQSLADAGVGLFLLAVATAALAALLALAFRLALKREGLWTPALWRWTPLVLAFLVLAAMTEATVFRTLPRADQVRQGHRVEPYRTFYLIPAVPISAEPVRVTWIGSPRPRFGVDLSCLLYLG